jgi:glycosyltransferase involved in cell wall biosynthesis
MSNKMSYTLGMTGPINVADFREFIDPGQWHDQLPKGQGGTPVNLLCRELLKRGQKLVVFSCDAAVKDEVILEGDSVKLCIGPKGKRPARNFFRVERKYLRYAIQREKPDIIHAHWTYEYAMPAQVSGLPHVITAHDAPINVLRHNFIPYRIARTLMAYRVISRARRIVSVSPYVADHLRKCMLYRGSMEVIPNGIPDHVFIPDAPPDVKGSKLTFATILVGWGGYKNGHVAIEAFARLRQHYPDARLVMFGAAHGPGEQAEQWARARGMEQGIEFVGQLPYDVLMTRLAAEVDILIHPSLEESQSLALVEAMALKIPVIGGTPCGAVPWTLDSGHAGMLVDVRSPEQIGQAMAQLAAQPALRRELGERGQQNAFRRFHISTMTDAYQSVYAQLAEVR